MPRLKNPFTPSFGTAPLYLAGRDEIIDEFISALDNGVGDPALSTVLVGARGTGKTSLLAYLGEEAAARGWVCANVTAVPGMLEDVIERSMEAADHLAASEAGPRIKSLQIGQIFGAEWGYRDPATGNWRTRMNHLLDQLSERGIGLLITVDEVRADLDEMVQLAAVYQHFVREGRKVALLMAGLPEHVSRLLNHESVSFLRRANQRRLGCVSDAEVADAFERTVEAGGREIGEDALAECVSAIDGFPYMMQLVGFRSWAQDPVPGPITKDDVERGISLANDELERQVLDATWRSLSPGDRNFLVALAGLGASASLAEVSEALGKKSNYSTKYKTRLLEAGVIQCDASNNLSFALPQMRDFVLGTL